MIYPGILSRRFEEYQSPLKFVAEHVKSTLLNYCEEKGYAFMSRFKSIESLAEKIETGRLRKWSEINDLFACTIIIPTLSYEPDTISFCTNQFEVIDSRKRGETPKAPETFRYDSTRIWAKIKIPEGLDTGVGISIYDILFEVQIRSDFEHAWVVSTHPLTYKTNSVDWRRLRLSAQIKAVVEQLDTTILGFDDAALNIFSSSWRHIDRKQLITNKILGLLENNILPPESLPKDLSRFSDNLYSILRDIHFEHNVKTVLDLIEYEINTSGVDLFPKSISLLQYCIAVLFSNNIIKAPFGNYIFHITSELLDLYPYLAAVETFFDYSN